MDIKVAHVIFAGAMRLWDLANISLDAARSTMTSPQSSSQITLQLSSFAKQR